MNHPRIIETESRYVIYPIQNELKADEYPGDLQFETRQVMLRPLPFDVIHSERLLHWARVQVSNRCRDDEFELVRNGHANLAGVIIRKVGR